MPNTEKSLSASAQKILHCAGALFAEKGYDGTIMDALAAHCGVNKASIYYHFQDKQHLYEVVLTDTFAQVVDKVINQVSQATTLTEKLDAFIAGYALAAHENPKMPALLMRELASGGRSMPTTARQQMQRLLKTLALIVQEGVTQNHYRNADVLMLQFMIIGSLSFHITSAPMREAIPAEGTLDPTLSQAIHHVSLLIQQALQYPSQEHKA